MATHGVWCGPGQPILAFSSLRMPRNASNASNASPWQAPASESESARSSAFQLGPPFRPSEKLASLLETPIYNHYTVTTRHLKIPYPFLSPSGSSEDLPTLDAPMKATSFASKQLTARLARNLETLKPPPLFTTQSERERERPRERVRGSTQVLSRILSLLPPGAPGGWSGSGGTGRAASGVKTFKTAEGLSGTKQQQKKKRRRRGFSQRVSDSCLSHFISLCLSLSPSLSLSALSLAALTLPIRF